ncbi:MAG: hypothetical protein IPI73_23185 [Betaproteobacteria bacterium]|nr:hypothetical protein [Betaproteobacteria bacterium]
MEALVGDSNADRVREVPVVFRWKAFDVERKSAAGSFRLDAEREARRDRYAQPGQDGF